MQQKPTFTVVVHKFYSEMHTVKTDPTFQYPGNRPGNVMCDQEIMHFDATQSCHE